MGAIANILSMSISKKKESLILGIIKLIHVTALMYAPVGSVNMYEWRSVLYLSVNWRPVKEQAAKSRSV
jgi:hypothetical protein